MAFKSDRQRKGFFARRGNARSNTTPQMVGNLRVIKAKQVNTGYLVVTKKGKRALTEFFDRKSDAIQARRDLLRGREIRKEMR